MKKSNLKAIIYVFIGFLLLLQTSCGDNENGKENPDLNSRFLLQTDNSIKNEQTLNKIKKNISDLHFTDPSEDEKKLSFNDDDVKIVLLKSEIGKIFDPKNHPCSLPEKINKKLRRSFDNGKPWGPKFVASYVEKMPDSVIHIPRQSITNLLHWVTVKKQGSHIEIKKLVINSPTYNNLNIEDYILTGFSSFFYSLDCSGYLNAAIEGSGAVPGADIKSAAKSALETQNSLFVGGGVVLSPISAAYYGNKVEIDTITRIKILKALLSTINEIQNITDNDTIIINSAYDAVWTSKTGNSSFNGKAELGTRGSVGFGVAQISASANGGGALARKSTFSDFNTYITNEHPLDDLNEFTISQLKAVIRSLEGD